MLRGRVKCPRPGNARGFSEGPRVGHEERPRSRELLERWELRGGRESRGSFRGKEPTQRPGQEAGGPPPGPPRFGEGEGGVGPGRRGGQSGLEREVGRALRGSQDWPGAASSLCTLRIPVVQGRATARAPDTHPDLESFPSKESASSGIRIRGPLFGSLGPPLISALLPGRDPAVLELCARIRTAGAG